MREEGDTQQMTTILEELNCEEFLYTISEVVGASLVFQDCLALDRFLMSYAVKECKFKYCSSATSQRMIHSMREVWWVQGGRIRYRAEPEGAQMRDKIVNMITMAYGIGKAQPAQKRQSAWHQDGAGWGTGGWGAGQESKKPKYDGTPKTWEDDTIFDETKTPKTNWGLQLAVLRAWRRWHNPNDDRCKQVACPIGDNCRFRGTSCNFEHRAERNSLKIANILRNGDTIKEQAKRVEDELTKSRRW